MKEDYRGMYTEMHDAKLKLFAGYSVKSYTAQIAELVHRTGATSLLDYGSGKGYQYLVLRVHEKWGGILPVCYDVGVRQLAHRPEGTFGGVICTDVLEHIAEEDLDEIIGDALGFVQPGGFAFFAVSVRSAKKQLPDGRNAHLTVRPREWWLQRMRRYSRQDIMIEVAFDDADQPE